LTESGRFLKRVPVSMLFDQSKHGSAIGGRLGVIVGPKKPQALDAMPIHELPERVRGRGLTHRVTHQRRV